jgi:hypothetical protein
MVQVSVAAPEKLQSTMVPAVSPHPPPGSGQAPVGEVNGPQQMKSISRDGVLNILMMIVPAASTCIKYHAGFGVDPRHP